MTSVKRDGGEKQESQAVLCIPFSAKEWSKCCMVRKCERSDISLPCCLSFYLEMAGSIIFGLPSPAGFRLHSQEAEPYMNAEPPFGMQASQTLPKLLLHPATPPLSSFSYWPRFPNFLGYWWLHIKEKKKKQRKKRWEDIWSVASWFSKCTINLLFLSWSQAPRLR